MLQITLPVLESVLKSNDIDDEKVKIFCDMLLHYRHGAYIMILCESLAALRKAYEPYSFSDELFLHDYETNNWLKMHRKPMRRKPFVRKRIRFACDEFNN